MVKNYSKRSKTRKSLIAIFAATTVMCTGLAAACTTNNDKPNTPTEKKEDVQLLKNGNFEFFNYPTEKELEEGKAVYLIKDADNWTRGGDSSNVKSGVIGVSENEWKALTDPELKGKLKYNADLSTKDEDYVNYNGMTANDLLYKDTYAALLEDDDVKDSYIKKQTYAGYFGITKNGNKYQLADGTEVFLADSANADNWEQGEFYLDAELTKSVRSLLISNPETHYGKYKEEGGKHYLGNTQVYLDDNGNYFLDEELNEPCSNVLMIHNHPMGNSYNGISQHYSSQTITLEANTSAEISVWVKTTDLKFDKGYNQNEDQDRGAYIEVVQTVSGTSIDSFAIKAINTEKIIGDNQNLSSESNGWLKYTVYVNSCDFGESTIQLNLGLGYDNNAEKCTGYAFFDDVEVTKYVDLDAEDGSESYKALADANGNGIKDVLENTTCTLANVDDEKVYYADKDLRGNEGDRHSKDFHYMVDLASENGTDNVYQPLIFSANNTTAKLTTEKSDKTYYASALSLNATVSGISKDGGEYTLPENLKDEIITQKDLLGAFGVNEKSFSSSVYASKLQEALTGDNGIDKLPNYKNGNNMLVTLSAYGAAYTSTIDSEMFTLGAKEYKIVSFWVKTSDMNGKTAATITLVEDDEKSSSITVDSTGLTTNINDKKDIYNGWVQCFFFVGNATEEEKSFTVDFSFGNTKIKDTTIASYDYGWIAAANMQVLDNISEEVFNIASSGSRSLKYTFTEEEEKEDTGASFDEATGTSDIKNGIATPANYSGMNGGSSSVADTDYKENYDGKNPKDAIAGLINKDNFKNYANWQDIAKSFASSATDAVTAWNEAFGNDCYQPLIIVNNLRRYYDRAEVKVTAENYKDFYIKNNDGTFSKVADDAEFDEETEYYSYKEVLNYGFMGANKTASSNGYTTESVKVKVSAGAVAHIYLVDTDTREVLGYTTPSYSFYYDKEGNVLDKEYSEDMSDADHKSSIVYTLREDGLYDGRDGKVYANLYNLTPSYKYYQYQHSIFYKDGKEVSFDDLKDGTIYYSDKECTKVASHYLCASDGTRVYEYDGQTDVYYYLVNGKRGTEVNNFADEYARHTQPLNYEYHVEVGNTHGEWVTVNFFIHTGSQAKNYRIELWSGERESATSTGNTAGGAVAFDYSPVNVSSSNYSTVLESYENRIINAYKKLLLEKENGLDAIASDSENIEYYEKTLVEEKILTQAEVDAVKAQFGYSASYFTYTLYDSASYVPFNAETAKNGETGYEYTVTDFKETLAYFTFNDEELNSINVFADYTAVDQDITRNTVDDDDHDHDHDNEDKNETDWGQMLLLISSIILVVALVIAIIAIALKKLIKSVQLKKSKNVTKKNNYRQQRYIKKASASKEESSENAEEENVEEESASEESEVGQEAPAEETPAEEAPVTEGTSDEETPAEEAPVTEETEEVPAEETPATDEAPAEPAVEENTDNKDGE